MWHKLKMTCYWVSISSGNMEYLFHIKNMRLIFGPEVIPLAYGVGEGPENVARVLCHENVAQDDNPPEYDQENHGGNRPTDGGICIRTSGRSPCHGPAHPP